MGSDANPCTITAPCLTFATALAKTAAGGEIDCLDPGDYGAVTITQAIIIINSSADFAGISSAGSPGTSGIVVSAGTNDVVTLAWPSMASTRQARQGSCSTANGFTNSGIDIEPSNSTTVFLADSYISDCGTGTGFAAILVRPNSGAGASVSINRVQMEDNFNGVFADGSGGGGVSDVQVRDSVVIASSNNGINVSSTGASFTADVVNTIISYNINTGATVIGAAASLKLGGNTITSNVTGVSNSGGTLQSFMNNQITDNITDGTPITAVPGNSGTLQ